MFRNIIKLSANESALGTSPKAKREINKKINLNFDNCFNNINTQTSLRKKWKINSRK